MSPAPTPCWWHLEPQLLVFRTGNKAGGVRICGRDRRGVDGDRDSRRVLGLLPAGGPSPGTQAPERGGTGQGSPKTCVREGQGKGKEEDEESGDWGKEKEKERGGRRPLPGAP